jgi:Flp pilus assembly protein TadB
MKTYLLFAVLAGTLLAAISFAQESFEEDEGTPEEAMEREIHMRNMELELQQREAEMGFEQQMREIELQKHRHNLKNKQQHKKHPGGAGHCGHGKMFPLLAIICIVHLLVAIWIYQDIRRRNAGSGLWIVIALLTGLLGALVYAVVRLGDNRQTQS